MQRYFVPKDGWNDDTIFIKGEDVHHISRVMRFKIGDKVICSHPNGYAAIGKILDIDVKQITLRLLRWLESNVEMPVNVTIAQGLPKGDKMDLVLQKGTELGAYSFIPFQAERSIVKWDDKKMAKKMERFSRIVKEASEQSHRNQIPQVTRKMTLSELIEASKVYDVKIFPYEEEARSKSYQSISNILRNVESGQHILVCIGPEGGFAPEEIEALKAHGFSPVRLGPRILRSETASLYVLASISYHFEEMGCS